MSPQLPFTGVPDAIEEIRAGRMIIIVDDEDRENEGDLTMAAEKVTPEAINFMAKYGRGLVCLTMTEERLEHLRIGPMTAENTSQYGTAFCEAIDAREGVTTGISAYDRSRTIQVAIDPATQQIIDGDVTAQTDRVLRNLSEILEAAGSGLGKVVRSTVFLKSMNDFPAMNQVYGK